MKAPGRGPRLTLRRVMITVAALAGCLALLDQAFARIAVASTAYVALNPGPPRWAGLESAASAACNPFRCPQS